MISVVATHSSQDDAGMDVHLDHAGSGHADDVDARVVRRRIAFDLNGQIFLLRRRLDRGDQFQVILDLLDRRHEHTEPPVARLDRHGGANRAAFFT
jgi:hypothetical protein